MSENQAYSGIGLMSGTSLDGLDIAFCRFKRINNEWKYTIEKAETQSFPNILSSKLRDCSDSNIEDLEPLNVELGGWMGEKVLSFCDRHQLAPDFISSHGHTVRHNPSKGYSIQIGDGQTIANATNLKVVNDFRTSDIDLGGQGAPLVPIGDLNLFNEYKYCLNLGGIANVSVKSGSSIKAFDICICNTGLNFFSQMFNLPYDKDGVIGRRGQIDHVTLNELNNLSFYKLPSPKSLDSSFFYKEVLGILESAEINIENQLTTLYHHIADQISSHLKEGDSEVLVTGGGAYNSFLMELIRETAKTKIVIPNGNLVEYKEALIFAYMGLLSILNMNNVLAEVTGAKNDHRAGNIWYPE